MDAFIIKKIISALVNPLPLTCAVLCIGFIALLLDKKRLATWCTGIGLAAILAMSTPWLPGRLLGSVEHQFKQFDQSMQVDTIVVLGCGHVNDARLPLTGQLHPCSLARVTEAARIHLLNPDSNIITTGDGPTQPFSTAEMHSLMLVALGVDEQRIIRLQGARDTEDEVRQLAGTLSGKNTVLVTSASHMPRSMRLFREQGIAITPAPTEHLVKQGDKKRWWWQLPGSGNMQKTERWWHEFLGQHWLTIKSWVQGEEQANAT